MEGEWGKWQLLILMQDIQSTSHHIFNKTNIDYQTYLPYLYQSHQHQPQWTHNPNNPPSPTALQNVRHPPSPLPHPPILSITNRLCSPSPKPRRSRRRPRHGPHQQLDAHHGLLHPPPELEARGPEARAAHDGRAGGRQDGAGIY